MAPYSGDKHMDPFTQLRMLYKRKGIPLSPLGWFVVLIVVAFVAYQIYTLSHHQRNVVIREPGKSDNIVNDGVNLKEKEGVQQDKSRVINDGDIEAKELGDNKQEKIVKEPKHEKKIINDLGESGLAGGHVLGKLKVDETDQHKNQQKQDVKDSNKAVVPNQNEEAPDAKPRIPQDPRHRVTLDPAEFGGQIVELRRPDQPDEDHEIKKDAQGIPAIEPFVRDDRLVPLAHLEHIPKPQPRAVLVNVNRKPSFKSCKSQRLLVLVHSQAGNSELRTGIRATWYDSKNYQRFANKTDMWKVIFIVGKVYDSVDQHVAQEAEENNDLIQADFIDSQYENTRKFIIATKFIVDAFKSCPPKFVLKVEDNIFLNMISINGWLDAKFRTARKLYVGNFLKGEQPIRDWTHPLYVGKDEYAKRFFPDMLSGPVYLFSYDVVQRMTELYRIKTPIAMEDGYIGILMEAMRVKPRHNEHFWLLGKHGNRCNYLRMFFVQNVKPLDHLRIMASNKEARKSKECLKAKHINPKTGQEMDDENPA